MTATLDAETVLAGYDRNAVELCAQYERDPFEAIHAEVLDLLPEKPGYVLDVGAGSGRDAAWFAERGHEVVAVEPASALRESARCTHPSPRICWLDDRLPALDRVHRSGLTFDLIWLSAVWMHVPATQRERAFRKLVTLLRPGGQITFSLRRGPAPPDRPMVEVSVAEIERLARRFGLITVRALEVPDRMGRKEVSWQRVWLQLPDDGLGALPLLRHVILNDVKSSTYKIALLRVLVRIADGAGGLVDHCDDDTVGVPLGLVALYWLRAFKPLLERGLPQMPANRVGKGLGFVKEAFHSLGSVSHLDLRIGNRFSGPTALALSQALKDARDTIAQMPAFYITYPGSADPVFKPTRRRFNTQPSVVTLDRSFLEAYGTLSVPRHVWEATTRYAAWIEPVLVNEWIALMQSYQGEGAATYDSLQAALRWLDPTRETGDVRRIAEDLRGRGEPLNCVWTGRRLGGGFDVDHCLPFSAWPCNDLWNLLPAHPSVNRTKGQRLPSVERLEWCRDPILEWWGRAYLQAGGRRARFVNEARSSLPILSAHAPEPVPDDIFDALLMQRASLHRNQQVLEW